MLNPYGVIYTQGPNEETIHIMFALAEELNANVYNENFKKYSSFEDWKRKTRHGRKQTEIENQRERKRTIIRTMLVATLIICSGTIGWFLNDILRLFHLR